LIFHQWRFIRLLIHQCVHADVVSRCCFQLVACPGMLCPGEVSTLKHELWQTIQAHNHNAEPWLWAGIWWYFDVLKNEEWFGHTKRFAIRWFQGSNDQSSKECSSRCDCLHCQVENHVWMLGRLGWFLCVKYVQLHWEVYTYILYIIYIYRDIYTYLCVYVSMFIQTVMSF
jgi:hypothetical protein